MKSLFPTGMWQGKPSTYNPAKCPRCGLPGPKYRDRDMCESCGVKMARAKAARNARIRKLPTMADRIAEKVGRFE